MNMDRKVTAGLFAGSLMAILAWVSKTFYDIEIPADVAIAGATIFTGVIQFIVPNKEP